MKLFYHPDPLQELSLSEEESLHATKVLRLKEGDHISLLDGKGHRYEAELIKANAKKCSFKILETFEEQKKRSYSLHLAVAPTKNIDRIEWFVEKAVEIGIDEISFLQCEHSERKNINTERIEKIAVSALKQSMNLYLPVIHELVPYKKFISEKRDEHCFIAHLEEGDRKVFKQEIIDKERILILIGPEGDFSKEEIQLALAHGYIPVTLGESRLRTETAALAACFICNTIKAS
ncbi:MAG TPA: 16S rRNA (uracil(1498)-N(3))-methyltransferase [Cytophagaceae bacterium]|jgi:16S rRNA (uracil1498-N3)-methyltransferase|nr:16S rRNA (uracil(1498)-N(3))-methyltransferase [Cytophagaceae bacterium]